MNRQLGGTLAAVSLAMALAGVSESVSAKKLPPPPAPSTPSFYFVDSSTPSKVVGKAVSVTLGFWPSGLALIPVVGPDGQTANILAGIRRDAIFCDFCGSVSFESPNCSGTAYLMPSNVPGMPGNGVQFALLQPNEFPVVDLGHSMLFVATQSASQTITVQSAASSVTGDELDCTPTGPYAMDAVPAQSFGNIYHTYHQPFDVVYP